jgi:hypothetical protein
MMSINVCCGQGFTGVLNMTQSLFREFLLRLELLAEQAELLETDLIVPVLMAGSG